eukprot:GHVS01066542.1.p1 GENE.GHVS01066542.1~~GHVS01066542.1.p1  ORF type:complete len:416 (-),score=25.17 GHVS01066542.1:409-1656(-)
MGSAEPQENEAERTADESSRVEEERIKQILARENRRQQRNLSRTVRTTGEPVVTVELLTDTPPIPAQLARPDAEPMEEISEDEGVQNQTTRRMEQQRGDVATHDQSRLELGEVGMSNLKCVEPWIIHRAGKDPLYTPEQHEVVSGGVIYTPRKQGATGHVVRVPKHQPLRTALIAIHHDNITAGHFGQAKTYELISRSYTWKGLREEVEQYVARCHGCLKTKPNNSNPYGPLVPLIAKEPWQVVTLDFIGGLAPAEKTKNDEILVVVDMFTKMAHFIPCQQTHKAGQVANMYYSEVFRLHGVPKVIISDRDRLFRAALWREMHELMGTKLAYTSPYYPQSDGNTERVNRTLVAMLKVYTEQLPAFHNRHVALLCEPRMPPQTTDHTEPTIELQARRGQNGVPVDSRSSRWATRCS